MESVFTNVYECKWWGNNGHAEYAGSSGGGSDIEYNRTSYVPFLKKFITDNDIKTVVDLGCGDFKCGKLIYDDLDVSYTGYDAYKKIIQCHLKEHAASPKYSFVHLDFCAHKEEVANGDVCILKDVLQHWSLADIYAFLDCAVEHKKFKFILICNCCRQTQDNVDIPNGACRDLSCDFLPLKKYNAVKVF